MILLSTGNSRSGNPAGINRRGQSEDTVEANLSETTMENLSATFSYECRANGLW